MAKIIERHRTYTYPDGQSFSMTNIVTIQKLPGDHGETHIISDERGKILTVTPGWRAITAVPAAFEGASA